MPPPNGAGIEFTPVTVSGVNSVPAPFGGGNVNLKMHQTSFGVAYGWKF